MNDTFGRRGNEMRTTSNVEFVMWAGNDEFYWKSRCGRWIAREGCFGVMVLTDRERDVVHVVDGKMPEVEALVKEMRAGGL